MRYILILTTFFISIIAQANEGNTVETTQPSKAKSSEYVIVLSPDAIEAEVTAANELSAFLEQVTKHKYAIIKDPDAAGTRKRIFVGQSELVKNMLPKVKWEKLGQDGIVLKTINNDLILAGGRPRGTIYAVYTFLEDVVGCRWWTSTESDIPSKDKLVIPTLDTVYTPTFFYRETLFRDVFMPKNYKFMTRLKLNGHHQSKLPKSFGGHLGILGFVHTFDSLLPRSKYYKAHPQWYTGSASRGQLCLTNKEAEKELIKNAKKWLDNNPDVNIISISQNDGGGGAACLCARCNVVIKREGAQSGPLLFFVNRVAKELEKHRPGIIVETLAYSYTRKTPKFVRPRKNVMIRLCNLNADFLKPLSDRANRTFAVDLKRWSKIASRLFVWDYVVNFEGAFLVHPNIHVLGPNLRFLAKNHVSGIFEQGNHVSQNSEFQALKVWMLGHLMWNPFQNDKKLLKEFLNGYYGAAGPYIGKYLKLMRKAFEKKKMFLSSANTDFTAVTLSDMNEANKLFSKALAAIKGDAKYKRRVLLAKLPIDRLWINNWNEFKSESKRKKIPFTGPKDAQKGLAELVKKAKQMGLLREIAVEKLKKSLKIPATLPNAKRPPEIKLGYKKWFDIQEKQFRCPTVSPECKIVADKLASDGCAVVMPGNHRKWLVQCDLKLEGVYKYYVIVRYEVNKNKPLTGLAFQTGIHPSSSQVYVPIKKALDGKYHAYYLGEHKAGGKYLWVAPTNNPAIKGVYVDRVIAVKK